MYKPDYNYDENINEIGVYKNIGEKLYTNNISGNKLQEPAGNYQIYHNGVMLYDKSKGGNIIFESNGISINGKFYSYSDIKITK